MVSRSLYTKTDKIRPFPEEPSSLGIERYRSPFRRDYARVLHSPAFRRLQGKTQLFPGAESDYFRNRLTHSLEVAQVAKSIALKINSEEPQFKGKNKIDTDLVEMACLAHDLGHPPFGHNGELALDELMADSGGFEGNAQTFRILSRVAKHCRKTVKTELGIENGKDCRTGLNLTNRSFASVLKYDKRIPRKRRSVSAPIKGYYYDDAELVSKIKESVCGDQSYRDFRTLECSIMDLADDIAYSVYDLDDAFKAEFLSPIRILSFDQDMRNDILAEVNNNIKKKINTEELGDIITKVMGWFLIDAADKLKNSVDFNQNEGIVSSAAVLYSLSEAITKNGYDRSALTSILIGRFIRKIRVKIHECLPLSSVAFDEETARAVEVLKKISYVSLINSPRLKVAEFRGKEIVKEIFNSLDEGTKKGYELLPSDCRKMYLELTDEDDRRRVICDYVSGMTDRYALEFYARLKSEHAETIFKPL